MKPVNSFRRFQDYRLRRVTAARRVAAAIALGFHRARSGGVRTALVVAGVVGAGGLLAVVVAGTAVAEERSLARAVDDLPPSSRTVRAAWFGVPAQAEPYDALDAAARDALGSVTPEGTTATVLLRESTIGDAYVALGAVDGLARWVRLTSGRLPRGCAPSRCEVVQLRGGGRVPPGVAVVGRGRLRTTALFGDAVPADRNELERARLAPLLERVTRYHQPALPPLLMASDVRALTALPDVSSSYRSYGWVAPLRGSDVRPWDAASFVARAARGRDRNACGDDRAARCRRRVGGRARSTRGARRARPRVACVARRHGTLGPDDPCGRLGRRHRCGDLARARLVDGTGRRARRRRRRPAGRRRRRRRTRRGGRRRAHPRARGGNAAAPAPDRRCSGRRDRRRTRVAAARAARRSSATRRRGGCAHSRALARAATGRRRSRRGLPRRERRPHDLRRDVPVDARAWAARPGRVRPRGRPRAARGLASARTGAPRRDAGAPPGTRPRRRRRFGHSRRRERRRSHGRDGHHRARSRPADARVTSRRRRRGPRSARPVGASWDRA